MRKGAFLLSITLLVVFLALALSPRAASTELGDGEIFTEGVEVTTCQVADEFGNPITSANAGDVVRLSIMHDSTPMPTRLFIFRVPSNDPNTYVDLFYYRKYFSGTSSGANVYMKIQPFIYVEGPGVFIGVLDNDGSYCYQVLTVN